MAEGYVWVREKKETDWFEDALAEYVTALMTENHYISEGPLGFLRNDHGTFEYMVKTRTSQKRYAAVMDSSISDYLMLIGKQIFATGHTIASLQESLGKPVNDFTDDEILEIRDRIESDENFCNCCEPYAAVFDNAIDFSLDKGRDFIDKEPYIRSFMHVMYHAGVSVITKQM